MVDPDAPHDRPNSRGMERRSDGGAGRVRVDVPDVGGVDAVRPAPLGVAAAKHGTGASCVRSRLRPIAALPEMLRADRERRGLTVGQAAWLIGLKQRSTAPIRSFRQLALLRGVALA